MLRWSINLFRVRDIQLALHSSFVLLIAYYAYEGYGAAGFSGLAWAIAMLFAFFTCVVLHELGHSLTARRFGVGVRRILLMPIGGMAEFDVIPRDSRQELLITAAGPAVNFVIAGVLAAGLLLAGISTNVISLPDTDRMYVPSSLGQLAWALVFANLVMGLFNLIPVFPMDGGRLLRATIARWLPYVRATFWAATIGKVLAAAGFVWALLGIYAEPGPASFGEWLLCALFAFIFFVGELEYRAVRMQEQREAELAHWMARLAQARAAAGYPAAEVPGLPDQRQ